MTKYVDRDYWEDSLLMPDKSTPVLGGNPVWDGDTMLEGFYNIPVAQLADRTRHLKDRVETVENNLHSGILRSENNLSDLSNILAARVNLNIADVDNTRDNVKSVASAGKLTSPVKINGTDFDGSANITINAVDATPRIASSEKGSVNGVATLDSSGKVPSGQLPSYVDDVLEYPDLASFPATGEPGKIYIATDNNRTYRWTGSAYLWINSSTGSSDTANKLATPRTLTIGGTDKAFDGSANVSWSIAEIGALDVGATASKAEVLATSTTAKFVSPSSYGDLISWHDNGAISTGTLTLNLNTSLNHKVSVGGNITVATPSNATLGKTGDIVLTLTANATVSWATTWKFLGSVPNIGNSGSMWVVSYKVLSGTQVLASAAKVA